MIVVDTNVLIYLYLPTKYTKFAEKLLLQDRDWVAPFLWRSEFNNVLALYLRKGLITLEQAIKIQAEAQALMKGREYHVPGIDVLTHISKSECSSYDCEFVALASAHGIKLVTVDKKIIQEFPKVALKLTDATTST